MLRISALLTVLALSILAGCSSGDNVADIGGKVQVSQDSFNRWVTTTAAAAGQGAVVPDPPNYTKCIAAQGKVSSDKTSKATLKQLCAAQQRALRQQVLQQLVTQGWVLAQADKDGLEADQKAVNQQVKELKRQFKTVSGGVDQDDLEVQAQSVVLQQQLRQKAGKSGPSKPTKAQLESFYKSNQQLFAQAESRDLYLLLTGSSKKASQAAAALRAGQSWDKVFKTYNDSRLWNSQAALIQNVSPQSWLPELRKAIFSAPVGTVVGPVSIKPLRAYAVMQVKSSRAGKSAPAFDKSIQQVQQAYIAYNASKAGENAIKNLKKIWQPKTECSADYAKWYPCKGVSSPGS